MFFRTCKVYSSQMTIELTRFCTSLIEHVPLSLGYVIDIAIIFILIARDNNHNNKTIPYHLAVADCSVSCESSFNR